MNLIHAVTKEPVPVRCIKSDCVNANCLLKYQHKECEFYENMVSEPVDIHPKKSSKRGKHK